MTIHAYTERDMSNPAYINLSERTAEGSDVTVTVRSRGASSSGTIVLSHDQLRALVDDAGRFLHANHVPAANAPTAPAGGSVINFNDFVQHGRDNGANIVNGMPWHWTYLGHVVTHENDQCYLVGSHSLRFSPGDVLRTNAMGELSVEPLVKVEHHPV